MVWLVAAIVHVLLCLVAVTDVAARPMTACRRAGWLAAIVLAPIVGIGLYALARRNGNSAADGDDGGENGGE